MTSKKISVDFNHCFSLVSQVIKTKTEIATLMEFLAWLEKMNGDKNGVIFVYHEQINFVSYMMIEIMKKYNLWERFGKIAKGFSSMAMT